MLRKKRKLSTVTEAFILFSKQKNHYNISLYYLFLVVITDKSNLM